MTPAHPHALAAVQLANLDRPQRAHVNRELRLSGTPRSLYTLARVLRTAQLVDKINSAMGVPQVLMIDNGSCNRLKAA